MSLNEACLYVCKLDPTSLTATNTSQPKPIKSQKKTYVAVSRVIGEPTMHKTFVSLKLTQLWPTCLPMNAEHFTGCEKRTQASLERRRLESCTLNHPALVCMYPKGSKY